MFLFHGSNTDIMTILWEHLGIGEPLELVDEDQYDDGLDNKKWCSTHAYPTQVCTLYYHTTPIT